MRINHMLIAAVTAAASLTALPGCAVTRDQSTVGEYIDVVYVAGEEANVEKLRKQFPNVRFVETAADLVYEHHA